MNGIQILHTKQVESSQSESQSSAADIDTKEGGISFSALLANDSPGVRKQGHSKRTQDTPLDAYTLQALLQVSLPPAHAAASFPSGIGMRQGTHRSEGLKNTLSRMEVGKDRSPELLRSNVSKTDDPIVSKSVEAINAATGNQMNAIANAIRIRPVPSQEKTIDAQKVIQKSALFALDSNDELSKSGIQPKQGSGQKTVLMGWLSSKLTAQSIVPPVLTKTIEPSVHPLSDHLRDKATDSRSLSNEGGRSDGGASFNVMSLATQIHASRLQPATGTQNISAQKSPMNVKMAVTVWKTEFPQLVVHHASLDSATNGAHEFRVTLVPQGLGSMHVTVVGSGSDVTLRIVTDSSSVQQLIQTNMDSLRDGLSRQGLHLNHVEVNAGGLAAGWQQPSGGNGQSGSSSRFFAPKEQPVRIEADEGYKTATVTIQTGSTMEQKIDVTA